MMNRIRQGLAGLPIFCARAKRKAAKRKGGGFGYERWSNVEALRPRWDARTRQIAGLIGGGERVIEFGAGRMTLKDHLPAGCGYTPCDLVDRGEGTIVCDLNGDTLPRFGRYDVAVFSGVLEYVHDLPRLIGHLSDQVDRIIASYAVLDENAENRRTRGWVNDYTSAELVQLFAEAGFDKAASQRWQSQVIYVFVRTSAAG